jgi:hypothetical protein
MNACQRDIQQWHKDVSEDQGTNNDVLHGRYVKSLQETPVISVVPISFAFKTVITLNKVNDRQAQPFH